MKFSEYLVRSPWTYFLIELGVIYLLWRPTSSFPLLGDFSRPMAILLLSAGIFLPAIISSIVSYLFFKDKEAKK